MLIEARLLGATDLALPSIVTRAGDEAEAKVRTEDAETTLCVTPQIEPGGLLRLHVRFRRVDAAEVRVVEETEASVPSGAALTLPTQRKPGGLQRPPG